MRAIILFFILLSHSFVFSKEKGGDISGGGDISSLRIENALTRKQINNYLADNGLILKQVVLYPIINELKNSYLKNTNDHMINTFVNHRENSISIDIMMSPYEYKDCQCSQGTDACTLNHRMGAPICFDVDRMLDKQITFDEFVAITLHEHSHHILGEWDHENDLYLFKFIRSIFNEKSYKESLAQARLACRYPLQVTKQDENEKEILLVPTALPNLFLPHVAKERGEAECKKAESIFNENERSKVACSLSSKEGIVMLEGFGESLGEALQNLDEDCENSSFPQKLCQIKPRFGVACYYNFL